VEASEQKKLMMWNQSLGSMLVPVTQVLEKPLCYFASADYCLVLLQLMATGLWNTETY
jgi:hypothetical protein